MSKLRGEAAADTAPGTSYNRLLTTLAEHSRDEAEWLAPYIESVTLPVSQVLAKGGEAFQHVYFPLTAVMSVISRMANGDAAEVGTVGHEGMVGIANFLQASPSPSETVVQVAGVSMRIDAVHFAHCLETHTAFHRLLSRYTQEYLTQLAQNGACNALHNIQQRCARWLLMTHDRVWRAPTFSLTHDYLATMLGVRRAGVSEAAGALQDAGLIRYRHGQMRVLDRDGLEAAACECYGVVRQHFDRLLP